MDLYFLFIYTRICKASCLRKMYACKIGLGPKMPSTRY